MKFIIFFILIYLLTSCSAGISSYMEDYNWNRDSFPLGDFVPVKKGNYWVYNTYNVDSNGSDSLIMVDTVMITDETVIRGRQYFLLYENHGFGTDSPYSRYIADSSGYLVYDNGQIGFSTVNFHDTLRVIEDPGISSATYKMKKEPQEVNVPAGIFRCLNYIATVKIDSDLAFWKHPDEYCNYYAPGVGKVKSTAFYISKPYRIERRLVKYHIEN